MQRTLGVLLLAGLLGLTACSSDDPVSQDTAVPTESTASTAASGDEASTSDTASSSITTASSDESSGASSSASADETVALPGLLDPSDDPIANDDDVRTGTLDNGLTYYIRHN